MTLPEAWLYIVGRVVSSAVACNAGQANAKWPAQQGAAIADNVLKEYVRRFGGRGRAKNPSWEDDSSEN